MHHRTRLVVVALALILATPAAISSGGCKSGSSPTCTLLCWQNSSGIAIDIGACASNSVSCAGGSNDQYGRPGTYTCSWSNGRSVSCTGITYNSIGQIISGTCNGVGTTCQLR